MNDPFWSRAYKRGHLSFLVIAMAMAYLLKMTWFRWGDLIIDLGREMYVPAKLAEGAVLYRDIFYLYGPFSPYFNAFLYKVFGTNILSLVIGGILVTALTALLLYKISRMFLNVFFATFTALAFLFVLAFGNYLLIGNYNFILPYSYPATHAILFSLAGLYFLFRFLDRNSGRDVYFSGSCLFFTFISRAEIGLMLAVVLAVVVVMLKFSGEKMRLFRPLVLYPVLGAVLVYGMFFAAAGPRILESNLFDVFKSNTQASPFAAALSGINAPGENISLMLKSALFYLLLAGWFTLAGYGMMLAARSQKALLRRLLIVLIMVAALSGAAFVLKSFYHFEGQYRSMPFMYLIVGCLSATAYFHAGRKASALKLFVLSLFSFLLTMRILLSVHAGHYGFYILVPGFIVYYAFFFRTLPQLIRNRFVTFAFYAGFTLVFIMWMADHFQISRALYQQRSLSVPSSRGALMVLPTHQGAGARWLVGFLRDRTPKDSTVAIFPEGLMINFLAERENPLYYYSFLPQDMVRERVERSMVNDIALKKPDYVIVLQRPVEEYGSRGFGVDYGKKIINYIDKKYMPVAQYGPLPFAPDNFSAVIFKLNQ